MGETQTHGKKGFGNSGEAQAIAHLESHDLRLIAQNYRCDHGEIDLIMQHDQTLVFVEVKHRSDENFATVVEQISAAQCRRIRRAAQYFLMSQQLDEHRVHMRFDVVAIVDNPTQLHWLVDAF